MNNRYTYSFLLFFFVFVSFRFSSNNCEIPNKAFSSGEELDYKIWYNWGFIWLESGAVAFKAENENYKNIPCYKLSGVGATYKKYDWFYSVRDSFFAWVDTANLRPYHFIRHENEGSRYIHEDCFFSYSKNKAYSVTSEKKKSPRLDSLNFSGCIYDVLTLIYYARNIDFSKYKVNDTIPFNMFLENKIYPTYCRYLGKEVFSSDEMGRFNCIKFRAKLIAGTLFSGGESMTVWVTDDKNKIPVYVEAPILVGSVKAEIVKWKGLRNDVSAKVAQ